MDKSYWLKTSSGNIARIYGDENPPPELKQALSSLVDAATEYMLSQVEDERYFWKIEELVDGHWRLFSKSPSEVLIKSQYKDVSKIPGMFRLIEPMPN